jgi:ATP adenylyltransferase
MNYNELKDFLKLKMRMSHIYQPVMIKHLLMNKGVSSDVEIAKQISIQDPSQVEYYQSITNNMVGKVLRNHKIVNKEKKEYILNGFSEMNNQQIVDLIDICNQKLDEYIQKRGNQIWEHRRKNRSPISGSIKFEVLMRAKHRCELCGCHESVRALEIDHIVPKNLGGEDSINNYQALCFSCNSMKRDHDNTDLRDIEMKYAHREEDCIFCKLEKSRIIEENNLAYLVLDNYPVTPMHMLVIPKRHFKEYFDVFQPELNAIQNLLLKGKEIAIKKDKNISGFNIGINSGEVAGQSIFHCHTHLIPRRLNDVENPKGGVRHVIADKGYY